MTVQVVVPSWVNARGRVALMSFAAGLDSLGVDHRVVSLEDAAPSGETMVCWGVFKRALAAQGRLAIKALQDGQRSAGGDLVVIERGFVNREHYYVVGRGGLNGRATYPHDETAPGDRWAALGVPLRPWKDGGDEVLVVGQVPWDTSCQHVPHADWVRETCRALRSKYTRVVFRPHPLRPCAVPVGGLAVNHVDTSRSLADALDAARLVVTFSSTVGVDATVHGVPVVACDPTSMVYRLCPHDPLSEPQRPDRTGWASWLAYCQWSLSEMESGAPWLHLQGVTA